MRRAIKLPFPILTLTTLVVFLFFTGCSGGTRGTGASTVTGDLRTIIDDAPVADVMVTVESKSEEGEVLDIVMTTTNNEGSFSVEISPGGSTLGFNFSSAEIEAEVQVDEVPTDFGEATIEFRIDREREIAAPNVDFRPRRDRSPPPTPTSPPTPVATPEMEQPNATPTATQLPTATPTPEDIDNSLEPEREPAKLRCNLNPALAALRQELREQTAGRPNITAEIIQQSLNTNCGAVRRATGLKCQAGVRRLNTLDLNRLNSREKSLVCLAEVQVTIERREETNVRQRTIRGVLNLVIE